MPRSWPPAEDCADKPYALGPAVSGAVLNHAFRAAGHDCDRDPGLDTAFHCRGRPGVCPEQAGLAGTAGHRLRAQPGLADDAELGLLHRSGSCGTGGSRLAGPFSLPGAMRRVRDHHCRAAADAGADTLRLPDLFDGG